jgi:hypothetical protein
MHDIRDGRLRCAFAGWLQPVQGTKNVPCCGRPQMHLGKARLAACLVLGGGRYAY